tara:strand:+ start:1296 stop:1808 length:513 start_codon:yes stop_codon:yes gene_type:complete
MKFTNITLNGTGKSGARSGQGLRRFEHHYVLNSGWAIGTTDNNTVNDDYYVVWNTFPTMTGTNVNIAPINTSGTELSAIGIPFLSLRSKSGFTKGILDLAIVRKDDNKAVSITFPASAVLTTDATVMGASSLVMLSAGYAGAGRQAQIKVIPPMQGPSNPEHSRMRLLGY